MPATVMHNPACFANHMGAWAVEPAWFAQALDAVRRNAWPTRSTADRQAALTEQAHGVMDSYAVTAEGVAIVSLSGVMMKGTSKFEDCCNTLAVRQQLRDAAGNNAVASIVLVIDSPGGRIAGTLELANDVRAVDAVKPVHAYVDDMCCSAAYWVAAQARRITSNAVAMVGSLGVFVVLQDVTKMADAQGIKVHLISSGAFKGAGTPGTPVTSEHLVEVQRIVDQTNQHFMESVSNGRQMPMDKLHDLFDGRVHLAGDAKKLGLVDGIQSLDDTVAELAAKGPKWGKKRGARAEQAEALIAIALQNNTI